MALMHSPIPRRRPKKTTKAKRELLHRHNQDLIKMGLEPIESLKAVRLERHQIPVEPRTKSLSPGVPAWRRDVTRDIPSYHGKWTPESTARNSIMDNLHLEDAATREAIILKSKSIAPAYNKGAYQPITSADQAKLVGRK